MTIVTYIDSSGWGVSRKGYLDLPEITTAGTPATSIGRLYLADSSGTTKLYFVDSAGTVKDVLHDLTSTSSELSDSSSLGSETLTEVDFATHANWAATDDFDDTGGNAAYTHSAGVGTLTQAVSAMAIPPVGDRYYVFSYTVSGTTEGATAAITTDFAATSTALTIEDGAQSVTFKSKAVPGDFVIDVTSTAGGFTIDDVSLKEVIGGDLRVHGNAEVNNDFISHDTIGLVPDSGGGEVKRYSDATVTLSGASTVCHVNVPTGARITGCQFLVMSAVTSGDGATSWDAAFSGGDSTSLWTGNAFAQNTKGGVAVDNAIAASEVDITVTPDSNTFSGGVIRFIVYYTTITPLADV
jgi:hypothetical protein